MTNITSATIAKNIQLTTHLSKSNTIETKDATLIELLKRGTKVAVKCGVSDSNSSTLTIKSTANANVNGNTATVLLPNNVSVTSPITSTQTPKQETAEVPTQAPALAISLSNNPVKNNPVALTISQNTNGSDDVYTLAYSTDTTSTFFNENDVYNVPNTAMLLQAVDSIQLLPNSTSAQLSDLSTIGEYALSESNDLNDANLLSQYTPSRQIQAVLNSPLPESLAEFSTLHSKEFGLYGSASENGDSPTVQTSNSPLPSSPISYPTPPASHEGITQSSPFQDDTHRFSDTNSIFDDKKNINFLDDNGLFKDSKESRLSDCEQILKLKNELFNDSKSVMEDSLFFKGEIKSEYNEKIAMNTNNHTNNIDEFNQNISFLDESRNFLEDRSNTSSPLSAAFFSGTMSSAEEVKEALQEVLPNESIEPSSDIDLYYLPSSTFQSQIMLNSDDPLLSSSPKDFIIKHPINRFEFDGCSSAKKLKLDVSETKLITIHCDKVTTKTFTSPSNTLHSPQISTEPTNSRNRSPTLCKDNEITSPATKENATTSDSTPPVKTLQVTVRRHIVYKSNLRKLSAPYYTPSPILDPRRSASGLYIQIAKDSKDKAQEFEFGDGASVLEFSRKLKVNIGSDFQANIPALDTNTFSGNAFSAFQIQPFRKMLPFPSRKSQFL